MKTLRWKPINNNLHLRQNCWMGSGPQCFSGKCLPTRESSKLLGEFIINLMKNLHKLPGLLFEFNKRIRIDKLSSVH